MRQLTLVARPHPASTMTAADVRYGRRGGRWLPSRPADVEAVAAWQRQRDALEAASARSAEQAGDQLDLFDDEALTGD